jgi:predicted DCC family thiol-disulfide oxidoreductase YuxK
VCGLCNRLNQFVLKRDRRNLFRFAPLQGNLARQLLLREQRDPADLDTVYLIANYETEDRKLHSKAAAILFILRALGGIGSIAAIARLFPRSFLDWAYDRVARNRYRIFGQYAACPIPTAQTRAKFLDLP